LAAADSSIEEDRDRNMVVTTTISATTAIVIRIMAAPLFGRDWVWRGKASVELIGCLPLLIRAHKLNGLRYGAISALGKKVAIVAAKDLQARLKPLIRKTQPYAKKIAHRGIWVEPSLLAEIEYRGKSAEGKVRHPFFKGVREDFSGRTLLRLFCSEHGPAVGLFGAMRRVPCRATDQRVWLHVTRKTNQRRVRLFPAALRLVTKFCPRVAHRTDLKFLPHLSSARVRGDEYFIFPR
jgi:hypothetical protein